MAGRSPTRETLHAAVSYQKLAGTLTLSDQTLSWTPSSSTSSSATTLSIPLTTISGLSVSKSGSPKVSLQVALYDDGVAATGIGKGKVLFTFTGGINSDQIKAEEQREEYKAALIEVVGENRARIEKAAAGGVAAAQAGSVAVSSTNVSTPLAGATTGPHSGTESPAITSTPAPANPKPANDDEGGELRLRYSLLRANPSLQALHKQTVMSGLIPDSEFWAHPTRHSLLRAARQAAGQRKGRNARIVDPRFQSDNDGNLRLEITDDDRRDLLDQNEILRLAHQENVPSKLDEATFWQRYFASSLYHTLRTSSRSASLLNNSRATGGGPVSRSAIVQPDEIFDSYLPLVQAKYVDSLEPPPQVGGHREAQNRLIDLGATEGDHNDRGNEKDWTMRGGAEKGVLPLVRRFNEHSERVLSSSLGKLDEALPHPSLSGEALEAEQIGGGRRHKRARTEGERGVELEDQIHSAHAQRYEEEIVIEDLEERRERIAVPLELTIGEDSRNRGRRRKTEIAHQNAEGDVPRMTKKQVLQGMSDSLSAMPKNGTIILSFLAARQSSTQKGLAFLVEDELRALLLARRGRGYFDLQDLPDHLRKRTLEIHGTSIEVLRHFWSAVSPPDEDDKLVKLEEGEAPAAPLTASERDEKAKRMLSIVGKVPSQIEELLHQSGGGEDEDKIASALAITLDAVKRAVIVGEQLYGERDD